MKVGCCGGAPASGGAGQKADLHQIGLVHILNGDGLLIATAQSIQAHRAASVFWMIAASIRLSLESIEAQLVNLQPVQRYFEPYDMITPSLITGKIAFQRAGLQLGGV